MISKESLEENVAVSEQEIADYYDLNTSQFLAPEQVSVSYIDLNAANLTLDSNVSEADVKASYQQNSAQYIEPEKRRVAHILVDNSEDDDAAKAKAEDLLAQLQQGAEYSAALAESSSDDIVSAEMGGDLDWIERDTATFIGSFSALSASAVYTRISCSSSGFSERRSGRRRYDFGQLFLPRIALHLLSKHVFQQMQHNGRRG